jgi:hypothetical protein
MTLTCFSRLSVAAVAACVLSVALGACNSRNPTAPGTVNGGPQPAITNITPAAIQVSPSPQTIVFNGDSFATGLKLIVTAPSGVSTTLEGAPIQSVQPTTFQATVLVDQVGTYTFTVENLTGATSPPFLLVVQPASLPMPTVALITPAAALRSNDAIVVTIGGTQFDSAPSVVVTDPTGASMVVFTQSLLFASSTSIQLSVTFTKGGVYTFVVRNGNGASSNSATVNVT